MKNKVYLVLLCVSSFCFAQENDTISKIDSTKVVKLTEITVSSKSNKAGVYKLIIPKKILENETMDKTIKRVNFITVDNARSLFFKGKRINNILYNDKLITLEEFNKLNIEDVKNISIDTNHFNQATGEIESVIKVTEKRKAQNNVKGSVDFSQGFFQQFNYYGVSLSSKFNKLSSRLQVSNVNNQSENSTYQNYNANGITINNDRKLTQPYFSLQNIYDINDKSSFYVKNKYAIVNDKTNSLFSNLNTIDSRYLSKNFNSNIRYDRKFENNYLLKIGLDYINFHNSIHSLQTTDNAFQYSKQKFDEITFSPLLQKKGNDYELVNSFIITNRNYTYNNTAANNRIKQNLFTYFISYSLKINDKNSFIIGGRYQFEENNAIHKNNHFFLPNLTYLTKIDSIAEIELNYKRRIIRPSINSISNSTYLDVNGNEIINKEFLFPQIDNALSVDLYREFKKFNVNISFNYNFSKNYIATLYGFNNDGLTNTTINVDAFNEKSLRASLSIPILKEARFNVNYSISDVAFKQNNNQIKGLVNNINASFSGPLFKQYLFSINSFYVDRFYEYNAFYKAKPDFSCSLSRNYLKDKLNLNVEFRNILNQDGNRTINYSEGANYYFQDAKNQSRLFLISLTYNFGKDFKMSKKNIQNTNSDIKLK